MFLETSLGLEMLSLAHLPLLSMGQISQLNDACTLYIKGVVSNVSVHQQAILGSLLALILSFNL